MNTKIQDITYYTSGPWEVKDQWGYIKIHSEDEGVCAVHGLGVNSQANAHLIAAAPDLLAALENLVTAVNLFAHNPDGWDELKQAQAAIAKAKGE